MGDPDCGRTEGTRGDFRGEIPRVQEYERGFPGGVSAGISQKEEGKRKSQVG